MTKYSKYQDYVIKDGKLIGEFEEMYRDYADPWEQTSRELNAMEKFIGIKLIKGYGHSTPIEYGCGLGVFSNMLFQAVGNSVGVDISATAIKKAKKKYPGPNFIVGDILDESLLTKYKPDVICFVELSWYVLDKLEDFKKILKNRPGTGFFHSLMTYEFGEQKYGNLYFSNLEEIIDYWSDIIEVSDWGSVGNDKYNGGSRTYFYGKVK